MRAQLVLATIAINLILTGCSDNSTPDASPSANSLPENQTPEIDADPTPDTGTGGDSQVTSPDTTTNGAPASE